MRAQKYARRRKLELTDSAPPDWLMGDFAICRYRFLAWCRKVVRPWTINEDFQGLGGAAIA
jgi:hypothetical protein